MRRATDGRAMDRKKHLRASNIYRLIKEPFGLWCDYFAPRNEKIEEVCRYDEIRRKMGREFEEAWIKQNYPEALRIEPAWGEEALANTLRAMLGAAPAISSAQLWCLGDEVYGKADLLVRRDDASSDLGEYYYQIKEIKMSSALRDHHSLQTALYNRMLGKLQGHTPLSMSVVLDQREEVVSYEDYSLRLNELLSKWRDIRDGKLKPEPFGLDKVNSPWRVYANRLLAESMDLTLLPDVGDATRTKLRVELGVNRIEDLYGLSLEELRQRYEEKLGTSLYYHAQAYKAGKPIIPPGAKVEFPRRNRHLYLDFETSGDMDPAEPQHCYLIGMWDAEKNEFVRFLAKGANEEKNIFRSFLDYAGKPEEVCLYHWSDYEMRVLDEVAMRCPELSGELNNLRASCIDLKEVIKQQVYMPVPTYSIKSVAPFLGFRWRHEDVDALESMVLQWEYLRDNNGEAISKVIDYNEDDCRAMIFTDFKICREFGIPFPFSFNF